MKAGKGLIDPTPLWDDDGKAYLAYAFAGSRAGIKSILVVCTMNEEGTEANNDEVIVFDGHENHPTVEGPKFYKRNGYYYLFAPAGGVATGWQLVLRSKNVFGPYEERIVMEQGETSINGPHQGAWVETAEGEDWFFHFQDKGAYGRIVHLQPMRWVNDWPVIGFDDNGDGIGNPVASFKKPLVNRKIKTITPPESDELMRPNLGCNGNGMPILRFIGDFQQVMDITHCFVVRNLKILSTCLLYQIYCCKNYLPKNLLQLRNLFFIPDLMEKRQGYC